jgi:cell division protein FtsQ
MPSGLVSPRTRHGTLPDLGERAALVAGQRVGRGRRRPRRRLRRALRFLPLAALVLLLPLGATLGTRWLLATPWLAVASVEVRGASRLPVGRILDTAGIEPGTSILGLDTRAVAARVAALPEIRRADVVREFPNRVVISVEERRPFTLIHAGRLHWLDEEGRLLGLAPQAVVPQVPVVSGLSEQELASLRAAPGPKARAAVDLIRALLRSGSELTAEISEIDMSRKDGPVLYTVDGVEVRLGTEDWDERLARLEGVLAQAVTQDVRTVDLRYRDQVVLQRGGAR